VANDAHSASNGSDTKGFVRLTTCEGLLPVGGVEVEECKVAWKGLRGGMAGRDGGAAAATPTTGWLIG